MLKILKYISTYTIIFLLVLHTFISHPHAHELSYEEHYNLHKKSNSIIGIIRLIFHENNDENLDNLILAKYSVGNKVYYKTKNKQRILCEFCFNRNQFFYKSKNQIQQKTSVLKNNQSVNKSLFLRGPPLYFNPPNNKKNKSKSN